MWSDELLNEVIRELSFDRYDSVHPEITATVLHLVRRSENGITARELERSMAKRKYPKDLILRTCDKLIDTGSISMHHSTGLGRPTVRYKYVV